MANPCYPGATGAALTTRISKGGILPDINPAVNLVNALSLKYTLPMGTYYLDAANGDIFIPFSQPEPETRIPLNLYSIQPD
ncbi:phenylalanine--tRNA ligase beta subunit-related protein [Desulfolucanica intricata]|uniref:phenylalanine--tRNA ligase beta subunit-related protein n=1 Tax=Desulfolucanica intricata TaxID=1285191 RepID=UPI0009ED5F76